MPVHPQVYKWSRTLHWMCSAFCFAVTLLFAVTGITLNHASWFSRKAEEHVQHLTLPETLLNDLQTQQGAAQLAVAERWIKQHFDLDNASRIEQDSGELLFDFPRPGGYSLVAIDTETGDVEALQESRGAVAIINDLHKGRHSGEAWSWLIDISAVLMVFFSLTGLVLMIVYAPKRQSTWPLTITGLLIPVVIYWVFVP